MFRGEPRMEFCLFLVRSDFGKVWGTWGAGPLSDLLMARRAEVDSSTEEEGVLHTEPIH